MKIHLPNSAFLHNIESFLNHFDSTNPTTLELTSDANWVSIHPVVLAITASLAKSVSDSGGRLSIAGFTAKSKPYFQRMGLFEYFRSGKQKPIVEHEPSGRFIPLTRINNSDELNSFLIDLIPLFHMPSEVTEIIKYVLSELVRNVLEHSLSKTGAILCAQYFPRSEHVSIGVADMGVGIHETIIKSHRSESVSNSLRLALMPGITGKTSKIGGFAFSENAGMGLFFIRSIAKVNRNFFVLYSGDAMYKQLKPKELEVHRLYRDPTSDRSKLRDRLPLLRGTAVGIDINTVNTKSFNALLGLIRQTYLSEIKIMKKEKIKARFI